MSGRTNSWVYVGIVVAILAMVGLVVWFIFAVTARARDNAERCKDEGGVLVDQAHCGGTICISSKVVLP